MKMNLDKLLSEGKIETVEKEEFNCDSSDRDVISAENSFDSGDYDWAITISYTAVLKSIIAFMQSIGYRPIGKEHHKNAFEFMEKVGFNEELVNYFNKIRKHRNNFMYGVIESGNKDNALECISKAKKFVLEIRTFVLKFRTGGKHE